MQNTQDRTQYIDDASRYREIGNRYALYRRIGLGGMAEVFTGYDMLLDREVAIKIMLPEYESDATFTRRFRTEAQAAAQLKNPHTVKVFDAGEDDGRHYIVMELVHGANLKSILGSMGSISAKSVALIASQICGALSEAHELGIVHRDVKASNIMVTHAEGSVFAQIMDYGIARATRLRDVPNDEGLLLGTAQYMSPEQASCLEVAPVSDLYSLGVVMYEAAVGRLPFVGGNTERIARRQISEEPIAPQLMKEGIDDDLNDIILKAMKKDPKMRFACAEDMQEALESYLNEAEHPHRVIEYPKCWVLGYEKAPENICGTFDVVSNPCIVGRSKDSDIVITEASISRNHLKLTPRGVFLEVEDLFSSNGTFLNGEALTAPALCSAGDILDMGHVRVRVGKAEERL